MADFYIKEIQALQPTGPYYLGGSSFGGLAAFEMARQLEAQGEKVALLALLDTGTSDYPRYLPGTTRLRARAYELTRRVQHHRDSLGMLDKREKVAYVLDKTEKMRKQYRRKINNAYKKLMRKFFLEFRGKGSIPSNLIQLEDQIEGAGKRYKPQIYGGRMTLFRAATQPLGIEADETLGWAGLAKEGIEIIEVPGHHGSIVTEPFGRILAKELKRCLAKAQDNSTSLQMQTSDIAHPLVSNEEKLFTETQTV